MIVEKEFNAFESISNDIDWSNLSKNIRKQKEWNQEDLAKELDSHGSTVSKIERGATKPSIKTRKKYKKLAEGFDFLPKSHKTSTTSIDTDKQLSSSQKSTSSELNEDEKEIIRIFQTLPKRSKRAIKEILISFKDQVL